MSLIHCDLISMIGFVERQEGRRQLERRNALITTKDEEETQEVPIRVFIATTCLFSANPKFFLIFLHTISKLGRSRG